MRLRYFLPAIVMCVFTACNKDEIPSSNSVEFEMVIDAESIPTKTAVSLNQAGTYDVKWTDGDQIAVFESYKNNAGDITTTSKIQSKKAVLSESNIKASFPVTLSPKDGAVSYSYIACYPYTAVSKNGSNMLVSIKASQTFSADSFDKDADVLISQPMSDYKAQPSSLSMRFARIGATARMTLSGISNGEELQTISVSTTDGPLAGTKSYIILDGTSNSGVTSASSKIDLTPSAKTVINGPIDVWFRLLPISLENNLKVEAKTSSATYTRNVNLAELGKSLVFSEGGLTTFKVNMSSGREGNMLSEAVIPDGEYLFSMVTSDSDGKENGPKALVAKLGTANVMLAQTYYDFTYTGDTINVPSGYEAYVWSISYDQMNDSYTLSSLADTENNKLGYSSLSKTELSLGKGSSFKANKNDDGTIEFYAAEGSNVRYIGYNYNNGNDRFAFYAASYLHKWVAIPANLDKTPTISLLNNNATCESVAGSHSIVSAYSLNNAVDSDVIVTVDGTVVTNATLSNGNVSYTVTEGTSERSGWIKLSLGSVVKTISITQSAPVTVTSSYIFEPVKSASNTAYANYYDVDINGVTWNVPGNQSYEGYWRIGGKSLSSVERILTSKDAIDVDVNTVTIYSNGVSNKNLKVNSVSIRVYSDSQYTKLVEEQTKTEPTDLSSIVFAKDVDKSWKSCYYKIVFNLSNSTTSNHGVDLTKITFSK